MKPKLYKQKQQVAAMRKLLKNYQSKNGRLVDCPLCKVLENTHNCDPCVWKVETGESCVNRQHSFYNNLYPIFELRNKKHKYWTKKRIKELKIWVKKYEK